MFIGYATILHPKNQAILRWGKNPTILQRVIITIEVYFFIIA
jgi:hypothetical protein